MITDLWKKRLPDTWDAARKSLANGAVAVRIAYIGNKSFGEEIIKEAEAVGFIAENHYDDRTGAFPYITLAILNA